MSKSSFPHYLCLAPFNLQRPMQICGKKLSITYYYFPDVSSSWRVQTLSRSGLKKRCISTCSPNTAEHENNAQQRHSKHLTILCRRLSYTDQWTLDTWLSGPHPQGLKDVLSVATTHIFLSFPLPLSVPGACTAVVTAGVVERYLGVVVMGSTADKA